MRWVYGALIAALLAIQVYATPTVWRCWWSDGNWYKPWGKAHCELEGWRAVGRALF